MFKELIKIKIEKIVKITEKFCKSILFSINEKRKILTFSLGSMLTTTRVKIKKIMILLFEEIFFLSSTKPTKKNRKAIIKKLKFSVVIEKNISVLFKLNTVVASK